MAFDEVQFPPTVSYGARGGPRRITQIVELRSGFEQRNQAQQNSRRVYNASMGIRNLGNLHDVIEFWEARGGPLRAFRWKDWADYRSNRGRGGVSATDVVLGAGDGTKTAFQLLKLYTSGNQTYTRRIQKPVQNTVVIAFDGTTQSTGFTIDHSTGIITFDVAPGNGVEVTAGYEFDVPVRFTNDSIEVSIDGFEAGGVPAIDVIEVKI